MEIQENANDVPTGDKRTSNDLESIEWGTPSTGGKRKLYFNIREDTEVDVQRMIDIQNRLAIYANP